MITIHDLVNGCSLSGYIICMRSEAVKLYTKTFYTNQLVHEEGGGVKPWKCTYHSIVCVHLIS